MGQLHVRIKYYCKTLALIMSESAAKNVGMNMKGLFFPSVRMGYAIQESRGEGLSRIEITYTASDQAGEDEILDDEFPDRVTIDLNRAQLALNKVTKLGW